MGKRPFYTDSFVEIKGLDNLINRLKYTDRNLERAFKRGLKEAVQPVLRRARAHADAIADDGTYRDSLSLGSRANGAQYILRSVDVAAGVKEFAKPGAMRLVGSRSSTQRARLRAHLPLAAGLYGVRVGVPRRANPPRVMVPAVKESADEIRDRIEFCMAQVLKELEQ